MVSKKTKLELTWIGKDERPRLEPRILLEDKEKSYHAEHRVSDDDIFDNILIKGDNLLALKALEQEYTGKVKCIYIDPPFNTGAAFEHYDDNLEHSVWLTLMRARLEILRRLLSEDGCLWMHLDDKEASYAKVLLDEVFGRKCYRNQITISTNKPFGFKATSESLFKQTNFLLLYAKSEDLDKFRLNKLFIENEYDTNYNKVFDDISLPETDWTWRGINDVVSESLGFSNMRAAKKEIGENGFSAEVARYALENADRVFRTASVSGGAYLKRRETISRSKVERDVIVRHPNDDMDYQFIAGERVIYYRERLVDIDGINLPGLVITDLWSDISFEGMASEGGVDFPRGKKPEALIRRVMEISSSPGDLVLDSFGGSGTTAAVAHKMKRRWIMVELGEHCYTHIIPRLKKVIDGEDQGGITKAVDWKGGGGFRFYELAPSLLKKDKWDNYIINPEYNAEMLTEAMCKHLGFKYEPSDSIYWMHGHSTESDFIYVTTQNLTREMLQAISDEVGEERTLLICCKAFRAGKNEFPNLTLEKIPNAILKRCEWDKDDYSLQVESLKVKEPEPGTQQGLVFDEE